MTQATQCSSNYMPEYSANCAGLAEGALAWTRGNYLAIVPIYYAMNAAAKHGDRAAFLFEQQKQLDGASTAAAIWLTAQQAFEGIKNTFFCNLGTNLTLWGLEAAGYSRTLPLVGTVEPVCWTTGMIGVVAGTALGALAGWYQGPYVPKKPAPAAIDEPAAAPTPSPKPSDHHALRGGHASSRRRGKRA